ncbi:MAG: DEAD/DEAH box helicase [Calditrichia bacterium]
MTPVRLFTIYDNLDPLQQSIVQICSIAYRGQSKEDLLKCLDKANICKPAGLAYEYEDLKPILEKLVEQDILSITRQISCNPQLIEYVMRKIYLRPPFKKLLSVVRDVHPLERNGFSYSFGGLNLLDENVPREIRLAIYEGDGDRYNRLVGYAESRQLHNLPTFFLQMVCANPFEPEWFARLYKPFREAAMTEIVHNAILMLEPCHAYLTYLKSLDSSDLSSTMAENLALILLIRGQTSAATELLETSVESGSADVSFALIQLLSGNVDRSLPLFRSALKYHRKLSLNRKDFLRHPGGVFYWLALLAENSPRDLDELEKVVAVDYSNLSSTALGCLKVMQMAMVCLRSSSSGMPSRLLLSENGDEKDSIVVLFKSLIMLWYFQEELTQQHGLLYNYFLQARQSGHRWLEMEFAAILKESGYRAAKVDESVENLPARLKFTPLAHLRQPLSAWERCLNALETLPEDSFSSLNSFSTERLVYLVSTESDGSLHFSPYLQKRSAKKGWSKGRAVGLGRLLHADLACMSAQDHEIAKTILREPGYYGNEKLSFDTWQAALAAAGHPLLFLADSPGHPVQIIRDVPTVVVAGNSTGFSISISVAPQKSGITIVEEAMDRFRIFEFTPQHLRVAEVLGSEEMLIPAEGEEQLRQMLGKLSGLITIYSTLEGEHNSVVAVDAKDELHGHLIPVGDGFKLEMLVKPVGQDGPYLKPGKGSLNILATINGQRLQARRDLAAEELRIEKVLEACPGLQLLDTGTNIWVLDDLEHCLTTLLELQKIPDLITLEWPEGQTMKIQSRLDLNNVSIRIEQQQDWFGLSGRVELDDKTVMQMHELLTLLDDSPSGFVKIRAGEFLALTDSLQRRLEDLKAFSQKKAKTLEIHPTAAYALEEFLQSFGSAQVDGSWKEHIARLESAEDMDFEIPSTLQTELRDYQVHGFKWLARLSYLKFGACLADDMGLGKTIQALAVLLMRAKEGPALVVAPASVTFNWANEIHRFAPTLNVRQFTQNARDELVDELEPFDILICSYGLLQSEVDLLCSVEWGTVVLDEAQAIKNVATKRSKAAMKLRGGFKLITTGTPMENHLGELWTLFNFINPGLLGSLKSFNTTYAMRITKFDDRKARNRLKRLLQPFILRRLKSDVLDELPPKTEINLNVDLSREEAAFYEALRQKAVHNLSVLDAATSDGRFQVFAELMRLRRACCHTSLVVPGSDIKSTKLTLFLELVYELIEGRHKVLVFSQFVDHLTIISDALREHDISFQYLDGSTPIPQRKKRVEAFQAGEGDVFLISLRAGGMGLNLTAADYVIHMDPWWNPAVEDQASDRAHRIGQERPVTVYRFITTNTIEEKIIDLHSRKRDLADALLEGTDTPSSISVDELVQLVRE